MLMAGFPSGATTSYPLIKLCWDDACGAVIGPVDFLVNVMCVRHMFCACYIF